MPGSVLRALVIGLACAPSLVGIELAKSPVERADKLLPY